MTNGDPIILSTNELPWPISLDQLDVLETLQRLNLSRYPVDTNPTLRDALAEFCGARPEQITVANGAAEVLDMALAAVGAPGDPVLVVEPAFPLFLSLARVHGRRLITVASEADLAVRAEYLLEAVARHQPKVVLLASPGNPSGLRLPAEVMPELLSRTECITILDEAYLEHSPRALSWADRVGVFDNLMVVRTLSKLGLAGARVGYAVAGTRLTREMAGSGRRYRLGAVGEALACALLERRDVIEHMLSRTHDERERMKRSLQRIPGLHVLDSQANFNVVRLDTGSGFKEALRTNNIQTYTFESSGHSYLRISVGTSDDGDKLVQVLSEQALIDERNAE